MVATTMNSANTLAERVQLVIDNANFHCITDEINKLLQAIIAYCDDHARTIFDKFNGRIARFIIHTEKSDYLLKTAQKACHTPRGMFALASAIINTKEDLNTDEWNSLFEYQFRD